MTQQVAIIGAGPVGLTLSVLLSRYGIPHYVIDRLKENRMHPQAHVVNTRSMEIFRGIGTMESDIKSRAPPEDEWRMVKYCISVFGHEFARAEHTVYESNEARDKATPCKTVHIAQYKIMESMRSQAFSGGSKVTLLQGHVVESLEVLAKGVRLEVRDPDGKMLHLDVAYVVDCGGARSRIRRNVLKIDMKGISAMRHQINIHFRSKTLGQRLLANPQHQAMLYFVFGEHESVTIAYDLRDGEFVVQTSHYPLLDPTPDLSHETIAQRVQNIMGMQDLDDIEIKSVVPWFTSALLAERFCHEGRVFIAGDCAHSMPPDGALGMNSGIHDAHNLAWKLAAVLKGMADPELLSSYHTERHAAGHHNIQHTIQNSKPFVFPTALGLDPYYLGFLHTLASKAPLPGVITRAAFRLFLSFRLMLVNCAAASTGWIHWWQQQRVKEVYKKFGKNIFSHDPYSVLRFRYPAGAISEDDVALPPRKVAVKVVATGYLPFVPDAAPGCRFPHLWLQSTSDATAAGKFSTVDVAAQSGLRLTLLTDTLGMAWVEAGSKLDSQGTLLRMVVVAAPPSGGAADAGATVKVAEAAKGGKAPSGVETFVDVAGVWQETLQVPAGSAVLVRPDGHVAWRSGPLLRKDDVDGAERLLRAGVKAVHYRN